MIDQATDLRKLTLTHGCPVSEESSARLLVVSGGKGGVGSTTIAVNLAVALAADQQNEGQAEDKTQSHGRYFLDVW